MILWNERQWRREMLLCALVFQAIFLIELVGLWGMIVVDPKVHFISYENWGWLCKSGSNPLGSTITLPKSQALPWP